MQSDGKRGTWPPWYLDMKVAEMLNISALDVESIPAEWYLNALEAMAVESEHQEDMMRKMH